MTTQFTEAPIFDADQHMYETPDSLTKYLPEKYSRAVQFAQFGRQTRIVINNRVNDFIPNPTFERVAAVNGIRGWRSPASGVRSVLARLRGRRPADRVAPQLSPARRLRREVGAAV